MLKRLICTTLLICMLIFPATAAFAVNSAASINITNTTLFLSDGYQNLNFLSDGNTTASQTSAGKCTLSLMNEAGIGSVYLIFNASYGEYTIENAANGTIVTAGQHGFLHEYIDLAQLFHEPVTSVTFHFNRTAVQLCEVEVFTVGDAPNYVQLWQPPLESKTDILLLSAHGDDEQLFFAGLIPKYAGQEKVGVQVAYLTDHRNITDQRVHEMLDGLWATGCTNYPVFGNFPDFRIDSLRRTYTEYNRLGYSQEQILYYVVELLRRFKPQVVVGHDIDGEYGHGMHMVYTDSLINALKVSNDPIIYPELTTKYGTWEVPKTYLHLYKKNAIELDYDQPLAAFDGMTAFQVSQKLGYPCHKSQQNTWFTDWINGSNKEITTAAQITRYNPCRFGLYSTTVGDDVDKNDFLENVTTYRELEQLELERLEQERLEQEAAEEERLKAEREELDRIEAEKAEERRKEQERLEKERQEWERRQAEEQQKRKTIAIMVIGGTVGIVLVVILISMFLRHRAIMDQMEDL